VITHIFYVRQFPAKSKILATNFTNFRELVLKIRVNSCNSWQNALALRSTGTCG
jgi:hypothetical protein